MLLGGEEAHNTLKKLFDSVMVVVQIKKAG